MKKDEIREQLEEIKSLLKRRDYKPLNFNQAADYLGFSHSYLYKLTSRKIIPCHRPNGKMLFFSKVEIDEWLLTSKKTKGKRKKIVQDTNSKVLLTEEERREEEKQEEDASATLSTGEEPP